MVPWGRARPRFENVEVVLELVLAGDASGRVDSMVGSAAMEVLGIVPPLIRDRDECWVCQVL